VRDYKVASGGWEQLNTASPFNILIRSLTMRVFSDVEVHQLYQQHTDDTGQPFDPDATGRAFYLTQGQPWLVNALAKIVVEELVIDQGLPITPAHINAAKEILIQRQETRLDSLAERLREPCVRRIIEPILSGQPLGDVPQDDIRFVVDLGLCINGNGEGLRIANPIYQEILPRVLACMVMASMPRITPI